MQGQAVQEAQDCVDQDVRFQYQQVAEASVRQYIGGCHEPFVLTPAVRSQYEDEVRHYFC